MLLATPTPDRVVEVRFLSLDAAALEAAVTDSRGARVTIPIHAHALTPGMRVRCRAGRLALFGSPAPTDGGAASSPTASAPVPTQGGAFLGLVQDHGRRLTLLPDGDPRTQRGAMRFLNLCGEPLGLDFPGARRVLQAGEDVVLTPAVGARLHGHGRFYLVEGDRWRPAGNLRWLQLDDTRTLWLVLPVPDAAGTVRVRGIEERLAMAAPSSGRGNKGLRARE